MPFAIQTVWFISFKIKHNSYRVTKMWKSDTIQPEETAQNLCLVNKVEEGVVLCPKIFKH